MSLFSPSYRTQFSGIYFIFLPSFLLLLPLPPLFWKLMSPVNAFDCRAISFAQKTTDTATDRLQLNGESSFRDGSRRKTQVPETTIERPSVGKARQLDVSAYSSSNYPASHEPGKQACEPATLCWPYALHIRLICHIVSLSLSVAWLDF